MAPAMRVRMLSVGKREMRLDARAAGDQPRPGIGDALAERGNHAVAGHGDDGASAMIPGLTHLTLSVS